MSYHLAELNIGRLKAPLDNPDMKEFTDFLAPVNKLAEDSPGFVWRLQDESGNSSSYVETPFDDQEIIVNFSVWEDLESLKNFTFQTVHAYYLKNRAKWFHRMESHHMVLWWVPEGYIPSLDEAKQKLEFLEEHGSTPEAFTFKKPFFIN